MGYRRCVGRVGALAVATRMTVSIGVAVLVGSTVVPAPSVSPEVRLAASTAPCTDTDVTCALIMGFTSLPTPDDFYIDAVTNQFIAPTHPEQTIEYVAVTTPEEGWPLTGLLRLSCAALGPPSLCGPGGPVWPDEPWWKLSGLFDLTFDQSVRAGVADLETAMTKYGDDDLVMYGYSQGAIVAIQEKRKLAEQYPDKTTAPDIDFVLGGDPNLPNGGVVSRFPGLYIPILDISSHGPEPTNTPFDTDVITRQYDFAADFPLYPLNLVADLNAFLGFWYVHLHAFDVSLAPDPPTSPPIKTQYGDTTYYFFETADLPLFGPLRTLGVPEQLIDVVEPFFRVIVELGYDRSIPPGEPTPARLIPTLNPVTVTADLVNAIGEGINNAAALIGLPPLLSIPAARPDITTADVSDQTATRQQVIGTDETTPGQQVTGTDETTPGQQVTGTDETTPGQQVTGTDETTPGQQVTQTDETTPGQQVTQTDETTPGQQVTQTDETATPTVSPSKPWKRAARHETSRQLVRVPLGVYGPQSRELQHSGDTDAPITQTPAGGDVATTPNTASPESPSGDGSPGAGSPHREHRQGAQPVHPAQNAEP